MTAITWGNGAGEQGRCDAHCHSAKEPACVCICGGLLHGAARQPSGVAHAVEELGDRLLAQANAFAAAQGGRALLADVQREFFERAPAAAGGRQN